MSWLEVTSACTAMTSEAGVALVDLGRGVRDGGFDIHCGNVRARAGERLDDGPADPLVPAGDEGGLAAQRRVSHRRCSFTSLRLILPMAVLCRLSHEGHLLWALVAGQYPAAVFDDLLGADLGAVADHDDGVDYFPPALVGRGDHRAFEDGGVGVDDVLYLGGVHVLAAADDHVRLAVGEEQVAAFVQVAEVAGVVPAALEGYCGQLGVLPVAGHDVLAPDADLTDLARSDALVVVVDDFDLRAERGLPCARQQVAVFSVEVVICGLKKGDRARPRSRWRRSPGRRSARRR